MMRHALQAAKKAPEQKRAARNQARRARQKALKESADPQARETATI